MSTPKEPAFNYYLIDAFYRWLTDCGCKIFIDVDARQINDQFLQPYANVNGIIKLNVTPVAINGYSIDSQWMSFSARFKGIVHQVFIPISAILCVSDGNEDTSKTIILPPMTPLVTAQPRPAVSLVEEVKTEPNPTKGEKPRVVSIDTFRDKPRS